jgi:hypothetical protein
VDGEDSSELADVLDGWDSGTDLFIRRRITVDYDRLSAETELPQDVHLVATTSWTSSTSGMSESARPVAIADSRPVVLEALLPGDRIGGVLRIRTTVTTANAPQFRPPGIAVLPGSILVEDRCQVALEGTLSMFPVHGIDFSHTSLHPSASWHLESSPDLHAPFLGAFRLLLNSLDSELMKAVERGARSTRQQALMDELAHQIGVLLLELAIAHRSELEDRDVWPAESVGDVLARTLARALAECPIQMPLGPQDLPRFRTVLDGIVRAAGQGRRFE